jgi:hypothetical protein
MPVTQTHISTGAVDDTIDAVIAFDANPNGGPSMAMPSNPQLPGEDGTGVARRCRPLRHFRLARRSSAARPYL